MSGVPARVVVLAAVLGAAVAGPASARMYVATTSSVVDGVPAGKVEGYAVDGIVPSADIFQLDVVRDGVTVASQTGAGYVAVDPFVVAPGDAVRLTDVTTLATREIVLSGRPAFDASVACGSSAFAGDRDEGATVAVSALSAGKPLALPNVAGAGERFSGDFPEPLAAGAEISAVQAQAVDPAFTLFNTVRRPAGACPVVEAPAPAPAPDPAPAPPVPVKDVLAPSARLALAAALLKPSAAYKALRRGRFTDRVAVDEAGTVTQVLYLDDGATLPRATAAAKRVRTVLGTGRAVASQPGAVAVTIKLSKNGGRRLKRARRAKVALVTTVTDAAGNARVLPPKRFTVKRTK